MKLTSTMFSSLDGVVQGPGGPREDERDGFSRGGWAMPHFDDAANGQVVTWFEQADAFLLGRYTYEIFAGYWPKVTDPENPIAGSLNTLPKYVVTNTLSTVDWSGTTIVTGDMVTEIQRLKAEPGRDLQVHGSPTLVRYLLSEGLLDELRLITFPVILGDGHRLFPEHGPDLALTLIDSRPTSSGAVIQVYQPSGPAIYGDVPNPA